MNQIQQMQCSVKPRAVRKKGTAAIRIRRDYQLYLMMLPVVVYLFIFNYLPMYGIQIAFRDYNIATGITGSTWVGMEHFIRFFRSFQFFNIIKNTLVLSLYGLLAGFPLPIILALLVTQTRNRLFKNTVQTITYAPHFVSVVVVVGMLFLFLSPRTGIVNNALTVFGLKQINFLAEPAMYKHLYVWSGIWQSTGWGSIIYIAALSSVSPELYEAAKIDGASKFKQILHIDIPSILPTAVILLILNAGSIMNQGAQKAYLMQTPTTASAQEIISTYVYKVGLIQNDFSYSAAIGLFESLVNIVLLILVNSISKKLTETSLW